MSLAALLANNRLERHLTSSNELAGLRKLIRRDMADATVPGLSAERKFATAHNAVLQLSKMVLAKGAENQKLVECWIAKNKPKYRA